MNQKDWSMLNGFWLPAVGLVAYSAAGSLYFYLVERFGFPDRPGGSPPWYFIRRDYVQGLTMGTIGALCVLLGLLYLRRYPVFAGMLAWQSVIWFGSPACLAFIIMIRTDHVMDPSLASSDWPTFDAYMAEPLRAYGHILTIILMFSILAVSMLIERKRVASMKKELA